MTRLRILALDDDPLVLDLIQEILIEDYQVQATTDPLAALTLLDREDFDLLLLDLGIPQIDGVEIIRDVRARPDRVARHHLVILLGAPLQHAHPGVGRGALAGPVA